MAVARADRALAAADRRGGRRVRWPTRRDRYRATGADSYEPADAAAVAAVLRAAEAGGADEAISHASSPFTAAAPAMARPWSGDCGMRLNSVQPAAA